MSFNSFLLAKFTNHLNVGTEIPSLIRRYQALWAIYINILMLFTVFVWKLANLNYPHFAVNYVMLLSIPSLLFAFIALKRDQSDLVAIFTLVSIHICNFAANQISCLASSQLVVVGPVIGFLLTSSKKIQFTNIGVCLLQNIIHIRTINERFRVTLTEQQNTEILEYELTTFFTIAILSVLSYVQKFIKTNLWQLAQSNYKKTEEIAKEVVQAVKAKDTFVSSLSHEIRNPLNGMNGSIDYLLRVIKDPSHLQILNNAKVCGEVLLNLLNNVLDAAKLKSDKMEISYSEMYSLDFLKKTLAIYSEKFKEKHLNVNIFIDNNLPSLMWVDPARLLQIMVNLFSNALKFTPQYGKIHLYVAWCSQEQTSEELLRPIKDFFQTSLHEVSSTIENKTLLATTGRKGSLILPDDVPIEEDSHFFDEFDLMENEMRSSNLQYLKASRTSDLHSSRDSITPFSFYHIDDSSPVSMTQFSEIIPKQGAQQMKKGYLKVQISDSGCGIAEENVSKLFEMFGQADHTVGSVYGGTGLGLWLCRQLCQKMGGDISLSSKVRKGTTFVFYLPIANNLISSSVPARAHGAVEQLKALVVDDYAYNRDVHKLILEKENVQVTVASDGVEAVEAYMNHGDDYFQFILMDVKMPQMDGFAAAKKIREWETQMGRKKVDICFVSGEYYSEEEVMRELRREGGMFEYTGIQCLKKPIDVEKIKKLLQKYTTRRRKNTSIRTERSGLQSISLDEANLSDKRL